MILIRAVTGFGIALIALAGCTGGSPAPAATPDDANSSAELTRTDFWIVGELTQGGWIKGSAPKGANTLSLDGNPVEIAADGSFFAGLDRDSGSIARLSATMPDGTKRVRDLSVSPRNWNIEHVNVARRQGGATEAFMALRRPELARIGAARALRTGAQGWRQKFIWPSRGRISGRFGSQRIYRGGEAGAYHSGIDIAGGAGGAIVAPADGVVILAAEKPFTLEGNLLMIDHGMGLNSAFLHCSDLLVREGQSVKQGQLIGHIGMTGRATGPHLHWSVKWGDARLDPILLTGPQ